MKRNRTRDLILCSLFAALTAIGAFIRIPVPLVPFTLQSTAAILSGYVLGPKSGTLSVVVYILLGLAGAPVFVEGGGFSYIMKPTFGYLIGLAAAAFIAGKFACVVDKPSYTRMIFAGIIGLLAVYLIGIIYMYIIYNCWMGEEKGILPLIISGGVMVAPGNVASVFLAAATARRISPENLH